MGSFIQDGMEDNNIFNADMTGIYTEKTKFVI
ncbi:hypothetical protein SAMN05421636_101588 [Pricia antarctica]|uniref:Uncharacterized protein n=1 Tax=Pricia antarctica TaxID=641691 RepID=A0A1G6XA80_9FLAO|nr:hypothetical protein SAMN05421636_101588 [Pricia antarctica]